MGYEDSGVDELLGGNNPAAPEGLRQQVNTANNPYSDTNVESLFGEQGSGFVDSSQGWFNGANFEATGNGWNTDFMQTMFDQQAQAQAQAMKDGDPTATFNWYKRDDATGVIAWDDPENNLFVGDVFENGRKVANVYDQFGRKGGDLMMSKFLLDAKTQQQTFLEDPDLLHDEVKNVTDEMTGLHAAAKDNAEFLGNVDERQAKLQEGSGDEYLKAGGAAGGFALAAPLGAPLGPLGMLGAGIVGAGVGYFGASKNEDLLTEQWARAQEITARARQQYGDGAAFSAGMKEYSQVGLRMINPVSNIAQGLYDETHGEVGDGVSEFYAVDKNGERQRTKLWAAADLAGTLSDSLLQFTSPVGIALYMTGTGGHVAGQVGMMAQTGAGWDDRTSSFNEYEGFKENAAAAGAVGIDVVQFGFAGALAKAGSASRAAVSTTAAQPGVVGRVAGRLREWTGKAEAGTSKKTVSGMTFTVDDATGVALSARPSMTLLAPSEALRWVPASWRARNRASLSAGAAGPDDYYRAALELAGGNRFGYAVINGWAEGSEEAAQAVLEPISFDAPIHAGHVVEAYLYGAAAGAGMSLGRVSAPPSTDQVAKYRGQVLYQMRNQTGQLSPEEWDKVWSQMSREEKARASRPDESEQKAVSEAIVSFQEMMKVDKSKTSAIGVAAINDLIASKYARDLAHANPNADNVLQLAGMSGDRVVGPNGEVEADLFPANAGVGSAWQTVHNVVTLNQGLRVQSQDLLRRIEETEAELKAATGNPDEVERLQQALADLDVEVKQSSGLIEMSDALVGQLETMYEEFRAATDVAEAEAAIDRINGLLSSAFHGRMTDEAGQLFAPELQELARRSVEMKFGRYPFIGRDSYVILMPQISKALSRANAHGMLHTHQSGLKALGGDRDGDTMVSLNTISVPQAQLDALRAGAAYLQATVTDGVETVEVVVDPPDGEAMFVGLLKDAMDSGDPALISGARGAVRSIQNDLYLRYRGHVEEKVLLDALANFGIDTLELGDAKARVTLANRLFGAAPRVLGYDFGKENGEPEVQWLWRRISLEWDRHQRSYAANAEELEMTPAQVVADLPAENAYLRTRAMEEMASDGQTMAALFRGSDPTRIAQKAHYSVYRSATALARGNYTTEQQQEFIELFARLGSNMPASELARVRGRNAIQKRVSYWLEQIAAERLTELGPDSSQAMMLLANTQVRDVRSVGLDQYEIVDGDITLLQLLLRRSVEVEEATQRETIANDPDLQMKVDRLKRLSRRDPEEAERSTTAALAMFEVFGSHQLHDLLGESATYLGPQLTMKQLSAMVSDLTPESRQAQVYRWKRKAPYLLHAEHSKAPFTEAEVTSGQVSAYKVVVDAIVADAQTAPRTRRDRDSNTYNDLLTGFNNLHSLLASYRAMDAANRTDTSDAVLLEQMLAEQPRTVALVASLIPEAARLGAFDFDGQQIYAAPWVLEMLVMPAEKAALTYRVQTWLAEWASLSEKDREFGKLRSRFLQTLYHLNQQPDGFEMDRLLVALNTATDLPSLMETINGEPMWRGDRAELLAFFDDVAEFEADPATLWTANMPGQLQREAIQEFARRTGIASQNMAEHVQELETERLVLNAMADYGRTRTNRDDGKKFYELLELTIAHRVMFPDHAGPRMRDAALAKIQSGVLRMQDKGKADPQIAPLGEILVTSDEFGVKQSVMQTLDALTKYDASDIMSNPTLLADGPVLVAMADGAELEVDLSTPEGALLALSNESTRAFAKRVLFPTARDTNTAGVVQHYQHTTRTGLKSILEEQDFSDVFVPVGERLSLAQAHKLISMVEAGVRKAAIGKGEVEQTAAYFPIQQILNEFIVAYSHKVGANTRNPDEVRNELVIDVATALTAVAALDAQEAGGETLIRRLKDTLSAKLRERHQLDSSGLRGLLASPTEQVAADVLALDALGDSYRRRAVALQEQIADPNTTDEARAVALRQFNEITERIKERIAQVEQLMDKDVVKSTISMFTLTGDAAADVERKAQIREFLKGHNRIGRFQGNYMLIDRFNSLLAYEATNAVDPSAITDEEWDELGSYAATVYLAELSGHAGSSIDLTAVILGEKGEESRRYFDSSWSYLLDGFFNRQVLDVVQHMARQAKWSPRVSEPTVTGLLEGTLFHEKKLGDHTPMIVYSSLQAKKAMAQAPVGLAIPAGGVLPVTMGAYAGAGRSTFKQPTPLMLSTLEVPFDTTSGQMEWTPEQYLRLNNHFAAYAVLEGVDEKGTPVPVDLMPHAGQTWLGNPEVADSPYKVVSIARLNEAITAAMLDNAAAFGDRGVTLRIQYFDADSQPHEREWANNIYFAGVGRDRALSTAPSAVSEMIFSTGGISKQAQQGPLDTATKSGKGYKPTPVTPRSTLRRIEEDATSLSDLLRRKVLHMLNKEYDIGMLQPGDSTTLYKLMKQRHVVVGRNEQGEPEVWWAERALEWERTNDASFFGDQFPLADARVVALSDSEARTLLGEPGELSTPGVVNQPVLNLDDLDIFPALSPERLAALKLTRLGEIGSLERSPFAGVEPLTRLTWTTDRDTANYTRYEEIIKRFREAQVSVRSARTREASFKVSKINKRNARALQKMLGTEALAPLFARLNIPFLELRDMTELKISQYLLTKLNELKRTNPSTVVWQHVQGGSLDTSVGVLTEIATEQDFGNLKTHETPTYEDIVVVDLDSFLASAGSMELAYDQAKKVIRSYTRRGLTIVLASESGGTSLRADLSRHLTQGAEGYDQMAESAHFFAPINAKSGANQTRRAMESSLVSVQQVTAQSVVLNLAADRFGDASSENATLKEFQERPEQRTEAQVMVPSQIAHLYGKPIEAVGAMDQLSQVRDRMLEMLASPEGRDMLAKLGDGDPQGVPLYSRTVRSDGTVVEEPGIRSITAALDKLQSQLESNTHPLTVGQELMIGDLIPLLGTDGTILLLRYGFVAPNVRQLAEMVATPVPTLAKGSEMPARVAISPNELAETWTTRSPATILSMDPDHLVGASMVVRYTQGWLGKWVTEADGFKSSASPMPNNLAGPVENLSDINGARISSYMGRKAIESKQAITGQVSNFRWGFALSGIDFTRDMVEYVTGKKNLTPEQADREWPDVLAFLEQIAKLESGYTATDIRRMLDSNSFLALAGAQLNEISQQALGTNIVDLASETLHDPQRDPNARLGQVLLASLMAPGVRVEDVISTSGLLGVEDLNGRTQITLMPELFTDALNDFNYPELRDMLFDRINAHLPRRPDGTMPYRLRRDWTFQVKMRNPITGQDEAGYTSGRLQLSLEMPADENPTTYTLAGVRRTRSAVSPHIAMTTWETIGGRSAVERAPASVRKLFSERGIEGWSNDQDGGFWQMLRLVPPDDASYKPWNRTTPAQRLWMEGAHEKAARYLQPVDKSEWANPKAADALQSRFLELLGMNRDEYRVEIDYLVRQGAGQPAASADQDSEVGRVSQGTYLQILELMISNVEKNRIPTYGLVVPLPHETFLALVFKENQGKPSPWAPATKVKRFGRIEVAKTWDEWVSSTFGQVMESEALFSPIFRQDLDGFMHTYQAATPDMNDMPISMDALTNLQLLDAETNQHLASLDPFQNTRLLEPVVLETMKATLDALTGHDPVANTESAGIVSTSDLAKRLDAHAKWVRTKQLPKAEQQSMKDYRAEGAWYIESSRDTHNLFHNMVNLSVGMRLLNPALWTSAVVEVWVRNLLEGGANVLQGQTRMQAGLMEASGATPRLTREDHAKLSKLYEHMGADNRFLAVVYDELMYRNMIEVGHNKLGTKLESFARFSAKATSDPKFGMLAKKVAQRYVEAAWEYLETTDNTITLDGFIAEMRGDPLWLSKQFEPGGPAAGRVPFNPHRAGLNRIAQTRSVKSSVMSKVIMGGIDSMARNPKFRYNATGHLLKIPFLFTRFNSNALMTMTGLGGFDQMSAMFLDNRESKLLGRVKAAMLGREYNPAQHDPIDMTDVIEGVDLVRPFLKGAITHTGLMALGMAAGGLGLSGEDEESKRRRRIAEYLGTPYYYDPRQAQNDFLAADAVFLDALPGPLETAFRYATGVEKGDDPRSAAVPHWILRQFISPVVGIERFFETGDVRQIKWGFADSFSVMPNSVTRIWHDAQLTGDLLAEAARDHENLATPRNNQAVTQFLTTMVGVYEKALFESSFVNAWRNGADKYDRDPWVLPKEDGSGNYKFDQQTGAPRPTMERGQYVDETTGEVNEAYKGRDSWSAALHQFAENNFTAAMVFSLTTGQLGTDSSFFRKNMAVKTRDLELPPSSLAEAEALLLSAFEGSVPGEGALPTFSQTELESILKARDKAAGKWWDQAEITAEAQAMLKDPRYNKLNGAMSLWTKEAGEVVTLAGAEGIYASLAAGMINLGDDTLRGVYIPYEMRVKISQDWVKDLIQEGVDLGLDDYTATARAKRLWYGNSFGEADGVGLEELIWSDQIPISNKITYNQLNTTYTTGPDGRPWATPFSRGNFLQALGVPWPHRAVMTDQGGIGYDNQGNTVDEVTGVNTGLKALERAEESWQLKKPDDLFDSAAKGFKATPSKGTKDGYNFGYRRGYSGGGGGGGGGGAYFTKMYGLPGNVSPYGNSAPFINTSNPIIRRADVRRERVWSERGRLKQWQ